MTKNILVVDANASWVRALFAPMREQGTVRWLTVKSSIRPSLPRRWVGRDGGIVKPLQVPGWTRFPGLSTAWMTWAVKKAVRKFKIDLVVYTMPFYAGVAEALAGRVRQVYYAHDPFRFYNWDVPTTLALEKRMMAACEMTLAISQALAGDLRGVSQRPVVYSPNAVSTVFVDRLQAPGPIAEELQAIPRPIIGCVGQINKSYDWPLIAALADGLPQASFVFVGPIFDEPADVQAPMRAAQARPNVKHLGPKPHARLPEFLRGFDVCLNPLAVTEHNDRRSPLRFYDYLATDRPIVSTAIGEAGVHQGLIHTFTSAEQGIELLRRIAAGGVKVDFETRRRYIRANTWEARAMEVSRHFDSIAKPGARSAG